MIIYDEMIDKGNSILMSVVDQFLPSNPEVLLIFFHHFTGWILVIIYDEMIAGGHPNSDDLSTIFRLHENERLILFYFRSKSALSKPKARLS